MRCIYCYNPDIVLGKGRLSAPDVITFLHSRRLLLDGVVLSGGECTMHKDIIPLVAEIKRMGFSVKLDTNGSMPGVLKKLLDAQLIDAIALDFKALPGNYEMVTGADLFRPFAESLSLLIQSDIPFEVRTTLHSDLISVDYFQQMMSYLQSKHYKGDYFIQQFRNNVPVLGQLNYSLPEFDASRFSTSEIRVLVR
ncbi:putative radical-activating enzyme [Pedobacter sp. BAL39]|nr:putative radical-activating enzyme [Pedobacter sp. BAL39]